MNDKKKTFGFYMICLAALLSAFSAYRYGTWAQAHGGIDKGILACLIGGVVLAVVLAFRDLDLLSVAITACYAYALVRHLASQVGSFVDAMQGVSLFGDATQVGNILSISYPIGAALVLMLIAGFLKREK